MFLVYSIYLLPIEIQPNWLHLILTQYALAETNKEKRSLYQKNSPAWSSAAIGLIWGNYLTDLGTYLLSTILEALFMQ